MIRYTFNSFCCCSLQRRWRWKSCSKLCSLHRKLLRSDKQQQRVGGAVKEVLDSNPGARVKGNVLTAWCDTHTHTATYRHTYTHRESLKDLWISEGPWTLDSSNALYTNAVSIFSTAGQVLLFNFETRAKKKHTHIWYGKYKVSSSTKAACLDKVMSHSLWGIIRNWIRFHLAAGRTIPDPLKVQKIAWVGPRPSVSCSHLHCAEQK